MFDGGEITNKLSASFSYLPNANNIVQFFNFFSIISKPVVISFDVENVAAAKPMDHLSVHIYNELFLNYLLNELLYHDSQYQS